ncbi:MAG: hypothetical protein QOG34_2328 [Frankiaceae bacterium]|nr:hypothetical protein [Frankiaceae bacterium]
MGDIGQTAQEAIPTPVAEQSDEALLTALFLDRYDALIRFATAIAGSRHRAEDAVQDAYARLFAHPRQLRDRGAADAYLRSAVLNAARSAARRRPLLHRAAKPDADIASGVAARRDVVTALQSLPRREREAVALRYLLDLSERDTALALRVSVGAVKGYTSRGLARLAELLGDRDG